MREVGSGAQAVLQNRERGRTRGRLKGTKLTGGPGLSAGERGEEGENWPAGPRPRKEKRGRGGTGPKGRKKKGGGRDSIFFLFVVFFSNQISKCIFQMNFLSKRYFVFKTIITIKMHQHVCNKNFILNLYLILIPQIYLFFLYFHVHKIDLVNLIQLF